MIDRNTDYSDLDPHMRATISALDKLFEALDAPKQLQSAKNNVVQFTKMDPEVWEKLQ